MIFLIIGLGSMGRRRIRNLLHHRIKTKNMVGFDLSPERGAEVERQYSIRTYVDFKTADKEVNPDAYIISTPPHLHADYFLHAAKKKKHFFVEVATTDDGYQKLYPLLDGSFVAAPSFTFRYYQPVKKIKRLLDRGVIGTIWAFNHHLGQYLPDWHPWEDYHDFYVSRPESSACREMVPYELQWIQWLLNDEFVEAKGLISKCSDLKLEIPDTYTALLKSKSGITGTMMVEIIARPAVRVFRVLGSKGTIEWNWQRQTLRYYRAKANRWTEVKLGTGTKLAGYKTTTEEMYQDEIGDFLKAIKGKAPYPYSFRQDQKNFSLLRQIEAGWPRA